MGLVSTDVCCTSWVASGGSTPALSGLGCLATCCYSLPDACFAAYLDLPCDLSGKRRGPAPKTTKSVNCLFCGFESEPFLDVSLGCPSKHAHMPSHVCACCGHSLDVDRHDRDLSWVRPTSRASFWGLDLMLLDHGWPISALPELVANLEQSIRQQDPKRLAATDSMWHALSLQPPCQRL